VSLHPFVNTAVTAARKAGTIIMQALDRPDKINISKKSDKDFVTNIDNAAERAIIEILHIAYPTHGFLCEESGQEGDNNYQWIIDPIDGTTNFIHGFPHFCISIALKHNDQIEQAVIYDPLKEDLFTATRGQGALKNNHRMRVAECRHLNESLIATGFPFRRNIDSDPYYKTLQNVALHCVDIRRAGSAALDLAYVASGQLDGFFELALYPWDIAAGILLIKEAGGLVTDIDGSENYLKSGNIATANPKIMRELLPLLKPLAETLKLH